MCIRPGIGVVRFAFTAQGPAAGCRLCAVFLVLIYGIPIGIGVWWLVLLNRKDVARQFTSEGMLQGDGATSIAAKPRCPLPMAILACFQLFSACWMPMLLLLPVSIPAVLFGHAIFGRPAAIIYAVLGITLALCAIGLLLLKKWSYSLLIGYHVFYSASGLVGLLSPNTWTVMNEMMSKWQTPRYSGPQLSLQPHSVCGHVHRGIIPNYRHSGSVDILPSRVL